MKYFVILFALFATTFGQDSGKCQVKAKDSFYMLSDVFGSSYSISQTNMYYSIVGVVEQAVFYLADNPSGSAVYNNATLLIRDGITGESVVAGSFITFIQNGTAYRFQIINGQKSNCTSGPSPPIPQASKIFASLNTIYPPPGVKPKPGESCICQGLIGATPAGSILNLIWNESEEKGLDFIFAISASESIHSEVLKYRDLTQADRHFFDNPCPKGADEGQETTKHSQLIDAVYRAIRHLH